MLNTMPGESQKQITILIVDDSPRDCKIFRTLLHVLDYRLVFANDGSEALAKAAELRPDMILLDVMLPDMDGFEVCQQLRANPLMSEAPIIMVTALDDRASHLQAIKAGADDVISKPFDWTKLRIRIQVITRINRYVVNRRQSGKKSQIIFRPLQLYQPMH